MPRARRTCSDKTNGVNCPAIATDGSYCAPHAADRRRARPSRQARGYDPNYDRARLAYARRLMAGERILCWRCRQPVVAGSDWHLGHDEQRRIKGPEHADCNLHAPKRRTPPTV